MSREAHIRYTPSGPVAVSAHKVGMRLRPTLAPRSQRRPLGFFVHHGSPHDFKRFDPRKVNTGEGAQAKGWGIYTAEALPVAIEYAQKLARGWRPSNKYRWEGRTAEQRYAEAQRNNDYAKMLVLEKMQMHVSKGEARTIFRQDAAEGSRQAADALKYLENIPDKVFAPSKGFVYTAWMRGGRKSDFLDLDKPLAAQHPMVQARLNAQFPKGVLGNQKTATGDDLYMHLAGGKPNNPASLGKFEEASRMLEASGLKGLRYLDEFSRDAGRGTYNYVTFDGATKRIVRKLPSETFR